MAGPIASAYVELRADVATFEREAPQAVRDAMGRVEATVDATTGDIASSFAGAAARADEALGRIDGGGFTGTTTAATGAADAIGATFIAAADDADATLGKVDGGGFEALRDGSEQAGDEIGDNVEKGARHADSELAKLAKNAAFTVLGAQAVAFFKGSVDAASDLAETVSKSGVLFGDAQEQVLAFAETAATALGQSKQGALDAASTFAIFGQAAGLTSTELAGFSTDLVTLASDLASFNNTSPEQAVEALGAALRGENEAIRAYGVMLDEATLKQAALELGIYNGEGALTQQQKTLAAAEAIFKQTGTAQGDFARTSEGVANQTKIAKAEFENLKAEIGQSLIPVMTTLIGVARGALDAFAGLPAGVQQAVVLGGAAASAFVSMSKGLQTLGVAAGTANKAIGAIGLVLTAGVALYSLWSDSKAEATQATKDLTSALDAETNGQKNAVAATLARQIQEEGILEIAKAAGISARDLVKIINGEQVPAYGNLVKIQEALGEGLITTGLAAEAYANAQGLSKDEAIELVSVIDRLQGSLADARDVQAETTEIERSAAAALREHATSAHGASEQADRYVESLIGMHDAAQAQTEADVALASETDRGSSILSRRNEVLRDQRAALDEATTAQYALLDAQLSAFNSALQLEDRTTSTTDAINDYTTTLWQSIAGTYEGADANAELAAKANDAYSAALGQAAAAAQLAKDQAEATGGTLSAADAARIQRDELQKVADSLAPDHPLRARLDEYIDTLNNEIPKNLTTQFSLIFTGTIPRVTQGQVLRSANGDIFDQPTLSWIGEAGREAVIPTTRPARALDLLDRSGLGELWESHRGGRGGIYVAPGAALASFPGAVIQDATDVDRVGQRTVAAVTARLLTS